MGTPNIKIIFLFLGLVLLFWFIYSNQPSSEVKIGYFHGGRVFGLYRAYVYDANAHLTSTSKEDMTNYFELENVAIKLYSQNLSGDEWTEVPKSQEKMIEKYRASLFGKVTGIKIINAIEEGIFDGGTPGESSFVQKVVEGSPLVAVALLGHDAKDAPGKTLILRNGFVVHSTEDFIGKTFGSRRSGPGNRIFLSEFFKSIGLDPEKDVTILDQVSDDLQIPYLLSGKIDGALFHLNKVPRVLETNAGYIYRSMDWMDPEISHAVLVFRKDFIEKNPEKVEKIVTAYVKRIKYESTLPDEGEISYIHPTDNLGLLRRFWLGEGSTPVYDYPPLVRLDLLEEVQDLLFEYNEIDKKVDLSQFVDNSFVEKIYKELEQ